MWFKVLFSSLFILLLTPSLGAQLIQDGVYRIYPMNAPGYALDLYGNGCYMGNNVQIYQYNGTDAQKWQVKNERGYITLHPYSDFGFQIDNIAFNLSNGNNIAIWRKNEEINQKWVPEKVGNDRFIIRTAQNTDYVMDSGGGQFNGSNVHLWNFEPGNKNQIWIFDKTSDPLKPVRFRDVIPNGIYYIYPSNAPGFALDLNENACYQENNIQIWEANRSNAQKWIVENTNEGILLRAYSDANYVIDDAYCRIGNGNNIMLGIFNGGGNQFWRPQKVGADKYILRLAQDSNYVLDSGGGTYNYCNVHLWEFEDKNKNQIWIFKKVP